MKMCRADEIAQSACRRRGDCHNGFMPISLTFSDYTASGHSYADVLGVKYRFPRIYRKLVIPGETAVFYTGQRAYPGKTPLSYLGIAIVSDVREKEGPGDGALECGFRLFTEFKNPVPFKWEGDYLETKAQTNPNHWRQGVRRIDQSELDSILTLEEQIRKV